MTNKERILATLRGEPTDTLPFIPRIDNWFYAQKAKGTLPDKYKNATLQEMVDALGIGYHSIIPNFGRYRKDGYRDLHVGLGIYDLELSPWRVEFHNVGITSERDDNGMLTVVYDTPKGKITTRKVYTQEMIKNGATLHVIKEHAVKSSDDYDALLYIFQNAEVIPDYEAYARYKEEEIGDRGVAVALSAMWASAGHYLIKELMGYEDFYSEWLEDPETMDELAEGLQPFCDKLFDAALNSPAEVILSGANYDFTFTTPDVIDHYVVPALEKHSRLAHEKGKFIATHTDGDNTRLLDLYMKTGFDIADSICPAPMTRVTLKETLDAFHGTKTIWGGIPSIAVLQDSMNDQEFRKIVDSTMEEIGRGDHFIVSVADTLPPAADFERFMYIKKACEEFGPIQ
ncbi:MAG: uroporphyrinogen decarboxylase family protein [Eubacterium sp.]|nr:uroporphyrinogen decarboxylase family protein [Eubacterium sp.]